LKRGTKEREREEIIIKKNDYTIKRRRKRSKSLSL